MTETTKDRVLVLQCFSDMGGCGFLRTMWPNEMLNSYYGGRKKYEGSLSSKFLVDGNVLKNAKVFHFQRQITNNQTNYIVWLNNYRKKNNPSSLMIYDMDDMITTIPDFNMAKKFFGQPQFFENLKTIANNVDIFTVSTEYLADWITSFNATCKVKVIPNLLPKNIYKPYPIQKEKNIKPRIVWAGSSTHFSSTHKGDFEIIYDLIDNSINDFDWVIMGIHKLPDWLKHLSNKITLINTWTPVVNFSMTLKKINADFGVAPLIDIPFNRAKSNIKMLDYWSSDIVTFCSDVLPYKNSELFFSGDWSKDKESIQNIFDDKERYQTIINNQNKKLENYWLDNNLNIYMDMFGLKI
jgi:hypothetical protein